MITYYDNEAEQEDGTAVFVRIDSQWEDLVAFSMGVLNKSSGDGTFDVKEIVGTSLEGRENEEFYHFALTGDKPEWLTRERISRSPYEDKDHMASMDIERGKKNTKIILRRYDIGSSIEDADSYEHTMPTSDFIAIAKDMYNTHISCVAFWERKAASDKEFDTTA